MPKHASPKETLHKLQEIQENKEAAEEAKAALLEHNSVLKMHPQAPEAANTKTASSYTGHSSFDNKPGQQRDDAVPAYQKQAAQMPAFNRSQPSAAAFESRENRLMPVESVPELMLSMLRLQQQMFGMIVQNWIQFINAATSASLRDGKDSTQR